MPEQTFVLSRLIKTNTLKLLTEIDFLLRSTTRMLVSNIAGAVSSDL